jgi:hypothetical protein
MEFQLPSPIEKSLFMRLCIRSLVAAGLLFLLPISSTCQRDASSNIRDEIAPIIAPFEMPKLERPNIPARQFDIRDFGAHEGGAFKNTRAIQMTIDAAAKAGGGRVVIPEGRWLTGAIHLDNNIDLNLSNGAELLFSQDAADYLPVVFSRHEDIECYKYSSFIYAEGKKNIAVTGEGILNGQGKPWWALKTSGKNMDSVLIEMASRDVPVKGRLFDGSDGRQLRPAFFQPMNCTNILVEGVTFLYGAFWTITPTYCENVIIRKVHIFTDGDYGHTPNGDGVDPSSCKNVLIEDCELDTGDDCIAIKAGRDKDGLRVGRRTENVVIRNCRGFHGHGGVVVGSETSGGIRNVYAVNCQFKGTDRIVRIKTARGRGGVLENMWFKNLAGEGILNEAIHVNMLYTGTRLPAQPVTQSTPSIHSIHFENIICSSGKGYAVEMLGLPEMPVENVSLDGIDVTTLKGVNLCDVKGIRIRNLRVNTAVRPLIDITDGEDISFDSLTFSDGVDRLLAVEGANSRNIRIRKSGFSDIDSVVVLGPNVSKEAVRIEE